MKKRLLPVNPVNSNTENNKRADVETVSDNLDAKRSRNTENSQRKAANNGQFKSKLAVGLIIDCYYDKKWTKGVIRSILENVELNRKTCKKILNVDVQLADGEAFLVSYPNHKSEASEYSYEEHIRFMDPVKTSLVQQEDGSRMYIYEVLKRLLPKRLKDDWLIKIQTDERDMKPFDFAFLFEYLSHDKKHCFEDIMKTIDKNEDQHIKDVINVATDKQDGHKDILNVLGYVIGVCIAIEMDYLDVRETVESMDTMDKTLRTVEAMASANHTNSFEQLKAIDCPITKVVLFTVMSSIMVKTKKHNSKESVFQSERRKLLFGKDASNHAALEKRCSKLVNALNSLHSSQTNSLGSVGSLGWNKLVNGLALYLDGNGISKKTLIRMSRLGIIPSPQTLRDEIHRLATDLVQRDIRNPPPHEYVRVTNYVFDNADVRLFGRCESFVSCGNIHILNEKKVRNDAMNQKYIKDLTAPNKEDASIIIPTKHDDEVAQQQIDYQNYYALMNAFLRMNDDDTEISDTRDPSTSSSDDMQRYAVGDEVIFNLCSGHNTMIGKIKKEDPDNIYTIEYREDNGDIAMAEVNAINLQSTSNESRDDDYNTLLQMVDDVDERQDASFDTVVDSQQTSSSFEHESDTDENQQQTVFQYDANLILHLVQSYVKGVDDQSSRSKVLPATTVVTDIIKDLSSKHSEATWEVVRRYIYTNYKDFHNKVHCFTSDQEFMPSLYRQFFLSLNNTDVKKRYPFVLPLAMGHAIKSMACSLMTYYRPFFDEIFKSIGVKIDSPKHRRYLDGKHIKETVRLVVNGIETLRAAYANEYLLQNGNKKCIRCTVSSIRSPYGILMDAIVSCKGKGYKTVLVLDELVRPQSIPVSEDFIYLTKHFQRWVEAKVSVVEKEVFVGPSGLVHGDIDVVTNLKEESLVSGDNKRDIPSFVETEFHFIWKIPYRDTDDIVGLFKRCKQQGITPERNKSFQALALRFYHFSKSLKATNDIESAISDAKAFDPDADRNRGKVTEGTCLTTRSLSHLLFGSEAYAIIGASLFTKVKQRNEYAASKKCLKCQKRMRHCRCTSNYKHVVILKAMLHSVFMRRQPHYQRLVLMQLIHLAGIFNHPSDDVFHGAMDRIISSWSVSEKGDTYNMEPVDMLQEYRVVNTTKNYGTRDVNALKTMNARVIVVSASIAKDAEKRWVLFQLPILAIGSQGKRRMKEDWLAKTTLNRWKSIIAEITKGDITSGKIHGTQYIFTDHDLLWNRQEDSAFFRDLSTETLLDGYSNNIDLSLPQRGRRTLQKMCSETKVRTNTKNNGINEDVLRKEKASIAAKEAMHDASTPPYTLKLSPNNELFKQLDSAGRDKHEVIFTILNQLDSNAHFVHNEICLGRYSTSPILLSKIESDAYESIKDRCKLPNDGGSAPLFTLVDFLKDLQFKPKGRDRDIHPPTIRELARDILSWASRLYSNMDSNTVILAVDVEKHCSTLRQIQRVKRNKVQNIEAHFEKALSIKSIDDYVSKYGEYGDLMSNEKATFVPFLCDVIMSEMKSKDVSVENWYPRKLFPKCNLGFVGGGKRKCAFIGSSDEIALTSTFAVPRWEIELFTKQVINQGEGERMLFTFMHCVISHCIRVKPDDHIDTVFCLHSDDSDVIAGLSMPFVQWLEASFIHSHRKFYGSIIVKGPNKSAASLTKLSDKVLSDLDIVGNPTGDGFNFYLDIVALYYRFVQATTRFEHVLVASRPLLISACFCFMNNDYMPPCHGLKYKDFFAAVRSEPYKQACLEFGHGRCSPILERKITFGKSIPYEATSLRLSGMQLIFSIMMMMRTKTKIQMMKSLTEKEFNFFFCAHNNEAYSTIRAYSILAGEPFPVPDPLSLIARFSCANFILRQWVYCVYENIVTPSIGEKELVGTFWNIKTGSAAKAVCDIHYDLIHLWNKQVSVAMQRKTPWSEDVWHLVQEQGYGYPFELEHLKTNQMISFDANLVILTAFKNKGHASTYSLNGQFLLPKLEARSAEHLNALLLKYEKDVKKLADIFTNTLTAKTAFNPTGGGRPLLVSAKASKVSTGGYKDDEEFESKTTWPENCDGWSDLKMNEIFKKLKKDDEHGRAVQFLSALTKHILCQAAALLEANNDDNDGHDSEDEVDLIEFENEGEEEGDLFFDNDNDSVNLIGDDDGEESV